MKKYRKNIISLLLSFILLSGGNFAFALSHFDCISTESSHTTCEMECCQEKSCCESESRAAGSATEIKSEAGSCCISHVEEKVEQDLVMPAAASAPEKNKILFSISYLPEEIMLGSISTQLTHKFKTTNIYLTVSNLRI